MARPRFNTVPTELLEAAESAWEYFRTRGYSISIEPQGKLHYPNTPPMVCKRTHTEIAVLVHGKIDMPSVKAWVAMAKNIRSDFRVAVCLSSLPQGKELQVQQVCQQLGVGIYLNGTDGVAVLYEPLDQGMQVALPELAGKPRVVRRALGAAYEHFEAGRWREGFDESCRCLEQLARPYVVRAVQTTRLTILDQRGRPATVASVKKMTLGQLAHALANAPQQNQVDDIVQKALKQINPDRVGLTHRNQRAATEKQLRSNVGIHLLTIIRAIEELAR